MSSLSSRTFLNKNGNEEYFCIASSALSPYSFTHGCNINVEFLNINVNTVEKNT